MEAVPRAGWQRPGGRAASLPCGSRRARVGEPGSHSPHGPPGSPSIISSTPPLPFRSIPPLPNPSALEHPGLLQPQLPTPEDLLNRSQNKWKIGDVQPGSTARPGMGWARGGTGEASGGLQPLRPCCAAPCCRTRHRAQRGTGQGAGVTPWVFITACHFGGAGQPGQAHSSARSPPQHVPALQPGQHHRGPQHPQHCPLTPSRPDRDAQGWTLARVSRGASQQSPGLGACSHPWPWLRAHSWVGNHSSYFWFSPWEVLQEGGQEHPDLVPEIPKVPSLGWVGHTRSQGMALLGTGRGGISRTSPLLHPSSFSLSLSWSLAQVAAAPTKPPQQ